MAASKIARTPIQKFSVTELDEADLCARALWHGISFAKGSLITSDAWLLDTFATAFYQITNASSNVNISELAVHKLVVACVLHATFRHTNKNHYIAGVHCIAPNIYPVYEKYIIKAGSLNVEEYGAIAVKLLSDALAMRPQNYNKPHPHRTVLSSRIMFFLVPTMPCFNMNNSIALIYGLQSRPFAYRDEYCRLMYSGLQNNIQLLSQYSLPKYTHIFENETWTKVNKSDWWQRRVLDIAILIKNNLAAPEPNLKSILARHLNSLTNSP